MAGRLPLSWSGIPQELAILVFRRLTAHVDRVRFAAVCPQWRSIARQEPLPAPLPLLALPDGTMYSLPRSEPLRLPACEGYTATCGGNWLLFSCDDGCFVRDPLSNATMTLPAPCRARVLCCDLPGYAWWESLDAEDLSVDKVKFCSPHLIVAQVTYQETPRLAVCQPGADSWWSVHTDDSWWPMFLDMTIHQGTLYALDNQKGALFSIGISIDQSTGDPWVSGFRRVINGAPDAGHMIAWGHVFATMLYLVESQDRLLMAQREVHGIIKSRGRARTITTAKNELEVFEADLQGSRWTKLTTIGDDQVLFLRRPCSKSVCVSQYEMPGNRIIFFQNYDDDDLHWYDAESSSSIRVYDMRDGKISTPEPTVSWERGTMFPTWLFPNN